MNCTPPKASDPIPICCDGSTSGTFLGGVFPSITDASPAGLSILYLILLLWFFLGVALAADVFMSAIEQITSTLKYVKHTAKDGSIKRFRVRTWNPTVANLTLMALGSSAPEILLSAIELLFNDMYQGALGPSTIVGSAAFNLFVIIAVCVVSIPSTETRRICQPRVYSITAFFSVFAYIWLVVILMGTSPEMIDITEALLTFLLFPLLVWLAFVADKWSDDRWRIKWKQRLGMVSKEDQIVQQILPTEMLLEVKRPDGTPLDGAELMGMIKRLRRTETGLAMDEEKAVSHVYKNLAAQQPKSRAYYRVNATRMMTSAPSVVNYALPPLSSASVAIPSKNQRTKVGIDPTIETEKIAPGHSVIEFAAESYAVIEAASSVTVQVMRAGDINKEVSVTYTTVDGSAVATGEQPDYEATAGTLTFAAGQTTCNITIKIFDDDEIEPDEEFSIELGEIASGDASIGSIKSTRVTVINDDFPGTFVLPKEDIKVKETCGICKLEVARVQGCSGVVSMSYSTLDGTALGGKNFVKTQGTLEWKHQEVDSKFIEVAIIDDDVVSGKLYFEIELHSPTGDAHFDESTDGSKEKSLARVTILDDDSISSIAERAISLMGMNQQAVKLGASNWADQFRAAITVGGGDEDDEEEGGGSKPGIGSMVLHAFALPWKLICAFVPPASIAGGYPCFMVAIIVIGVMTAVIGDLANLLGCAMGIKAEVVAITFVALGTSLPDTFASRSAALGDPTADAAIGNVTGSNAVNVFLGLGISWIIGAIYWQSKVVDAEWIERYPDISARYNLQVGMPHIGLAVPSGSLSFSVIVFCVCACLCIATLALRRKYFEAELGSKMRLSTGAFFVGLWLLYVLLSTLKAYEFI